MTTINVSENEKSDLLYFYQLELNKALKRVQEIKKVLGMLNHRQTPGRSGGTQKKAHNQATRKLKTTRSSAPVKAVKPKAAARTKKKPPLPWVPFIHNTIKQQKKLLTMKELFNFATKKFNIPDKKKGLKNLKMLLSRMRKRGQLIAQKKRGDKRNFFGLPSSKRNKKKR